ncbi:hypothetical protein ACFLYE_04340 [Chloroflexota bacterium]
MINDLREFISKAEELGECEVIEGADWDLEIGAIGQLQSEFPDSPLLVFDKVKGYPIGRGGTALTRQSLQRIQRIESRMTFQHPCQLFL